MINIKKPMQNEYSGNYKILQTKPLKGLNKDSYHVQGLKDCTFYVIPLESPQDFL